MRKFLVAVCVFLLSCLFASCAGGTAVGGQITVKFTQEGQATVERTIAVGESLTDIPTPVQKEGYTVVWDVKDFSSLTSSITVKAIATPNTYTITYAVGRNVTISSKTQAVEYGSSVTLLTPSLSGTMRKREWTLKAVNTPWQKT